MKTEFLEHGMQYGWLGKQGVLFVGQALSIDKYDDFYEYAREIKPEIEKLIDRGPKELMMLYENIVEKNEETAKIKKLLIPIKELKTKMSTVGKLGKNFYNQVTYNKKIEAQQYSCLILSFYFDGLSRFLGLGEE